MCGNPIAALANFYFFVWGWDACGLARKRWTSGVTRDRGKRREKRREGPFLSPFIVLLVAVRTLESRIAGNWSIFIRISVVKDMVHYIQTVFMNEFLLIFAPCSVFFRRRTLLLSSFLALEENNKTILFFCQQ